MNCTDGMTVRCRKMSAECHCLWLRCFIDGCLTFTVLLEDVLLMRLCILNIGKHFAVQPPGKLKLEFCGSRFEQLLKERSLMFAERLSGSHWHGRATGQGISSSEQFDLLVIEGRPAISRYVTLPKLCFHSFEWTLNVVYFSVSCNEIYA